MRQTIALAVASLVLGLFILPQSAEASIGLEWDGKDQITYQFAESSFGFDLGLNGMSHGERTAKNVGRGISGTAMIVLGGIFTVIGGTCAAVAIYFFVAGAAAERLVEGSGLMFQILGVIFLAAMGASLGRGISWIASGVGQLAKISERERIQRKERYAVKQRNRAQWGMNVQIAGLPISR
ncbi:MAG: hypothetical protein VX498_03265 [Myxococcota bacterium]|nr:hypothetical protein [Myxococcota bacterium]